MPDLPPGLSFHQDEWHAAYLLIDQKPLVDTPPLSRILRLVAMPGGFPTRNADGALGVTITCMRFLRVLECVAGIDFTRAAAPG